MNKKQSHSSITTYLECQKKYELIYIKGLKINNIHLEFGSMAHKVLETRIIPDEFLYPNLKEQFKILSWKKYFENIFTELDNFTKDYDVLGKEVLVEDDKLCGVIDLVLRHKDSKRILLCDYKFSTSVKTYDALYLDEQLQIYAILYSEMFNEPITNIDVCYMNIPKYELQEPRTLTKGGLSKDKNQNTSYAMYLAKIKELNLSVDDYEEILNSLKNRQFIKIYKNALELNMTKRIGENIEKVLKDMNKGYYLEKCSYMCQNCPLIEYCKYGKVIKNDNCDRKSEQRRIEETLE